MLTDKLFKVYFMKFQLNYFNAFIPFWISEVVQMEEFIPFTNS